MNGQIATREEGEKGPTSPRARRFSLMIANFAEENERLLIVYAKVSIIAGDKRSLPSYSLGCNYACVACM